MARKGENYGENYGFKVFVDPNKILAAVGMSPSESKKKAQPQQEPKKAKKSKK